MGEGNGEFKDEFVTPDNNENPQPAAESQEKAGRADQGSWQNGVTEDGYFFLKIKLNQPLWIIRGFCDYSRDWITGQIVKAKQAQDKGKKDVIYPKGFRPFKWRK